MPRSCHKVWKVLKLQLAGGSSFHLESLDLRLCGNCVEVTEDDEGVEHAQASAVTSPLLGNAHHARSAAYTHEAELMPLHHRDTSRR